MLIKHNMEIIKAYTTYSTLTGDTDLTPKYAAMVTPNLSLWCPKK